MTSKSPIILVFVFALLAASPILAQDSARASDKNADRPATTQKNDTQEFAGDINRFMRIRRDRNQKAIGMETAITRYVTKNSKGERVTVDLIGVVHIGEKEYYEKLNELFLQYDALLYELVAPEGTIVPRGGRDAGSGFNPIATIQLGMKSALALEFQLEHIDYTVDNFVHADMTPEEFAESMKKNDESFFKMALKAIGQGMAMQSKGTETTDAELLIAMFSKDRTKLRRVMAEQMLDMESGMVIFQGKDGSTIINHRNTKALQIMREQIESGKKRIGIFYGAGHLPDMEETLVKKDGMKRGGKNWFSAWNLSK